MMNAFLEKINGEWLDEFVYISVQPLQERGFKVIKGSEPKTEMHDVIWRYKNGYIEDAVYLLMKAYPELHGLDKYIKRS